MNSYVFFLQSILKTVIMEKVNYLPWVGENYMAEGFAGRRVLALGESHYCAKASDSAPGITRDVILGLLDEDAEFEQYMNTYTKFAKAMLGADTLTFEDKRRFWNSIAFYNYVQKPMPAARIAPSKEDFSASAESFFDVLEELRPEVVIVWGSRLYNNLPRGGMQGDDLRAPDGRWVETWRYFLQDGSAVHVLPIMHPSAAFSPEYWHEVLALAI